jgi:DNA invertase Pin-like site-specific DNA recombinase
MRDTRDKVERITTFVAVLCLAMMIVCAGLGSCTLPREPARINTHREKDHPVKVAAYVRVSSDTQTSGSQRHAINAWLTKNGINPALIDWYSDERSGNNLNRPAFQRLQRAILAGDVDTVCVFKLDRISRNMQDGVNVVSDWIDRGIRLVAVSQWHDFSGVTGKLVASVLFSVAEMEQQARRERQAAGIAVAKERGAFKGRKPGSTKASRQEAVELKCQGLRYKEIAERLGISKRSVIRYVADAGVPSCHSDTTV